MLTMLTMLTTAEEPTKKTFKHNVFHVNKSIPKNKINEIYTQTCRCVSVTGISMFLWCFCLHLFLNVLQHNQRYFQCLHYSSMFSSLPVKHSTFPVAIQSCFFHLSFISIFTCFSFFKCFKENGPKTAEVIQNKNWIFLFIALSNLNLIHMWITFCYCIK